MEFTVTSFTCLHPFTEANCSSGSFRDIDGVRTFIPMTTVCENCKLRACDDCAESWPGSCESCGGAICGPCASTTRSRRVTEAIAMGAPYRTRTEFLCTKCAATQDVAAKTLTAQALGVGTDEDDRWLSDIVADLTEALHTAKEAM